MSQVTEPNLNEALDALGETAMRIADERNELLKALKVMLQAKRKMGYLPQFDDWDGPTSIAEAVIAKVEGRK